jgi:hypothetical protein
MATANYVLLRRITLTESASSILFDSIPQGGYTDLKIVISANCTGSGSSADDIRIRFNGNTSSVYSMIAINSSGSGVSAASESAQTSSWCGNVGGSGSIFNNAEIYIPNYLSTTSSKSTSVDNVVEANANAAPMRVIAQLWNPGTQAAISSVTLYPSTYSWSAGSSFALYGIANETAIPISAPKADGGDIIKTDGTYWYHVFTGSGTFKPQLNLTCDYLVVAGGGSGGAHNSGGGGGGGVRSTITATGGGGTIENALSLTAQNYVVTIGAGGAGVVDTRGINGSNTVFATVTSIGGGGGGSQSTGTVGSGGSGGGGPISQAGGTGTSNQGYNGGTGVGGSNSGGGGGGAGAAGSAASSTNGGAGGNGVQVNTTGLFGANYYWAGGGGGSSYSATAGSGGLGGAGGGHSSSGSPGSAGGSGLTAGAAGSGSFNGDGGAAGTNTGSGGGAANRQSGTSGSGGSGIVIIRYAV